MKTSRTISTLFCLLLTLATTGMAEYRFRPLQDQPLRHPDYGAPEPFRDIHRLPAHTGMPSAGGYGRTLSGGTSGFPIADHYPSGKFFPYSAFDHLSALTTTSFWDLGEPLLFALPPDLPFADRPHTAQHSDTPDPVVDRFRWRGSSRPEPVVDGRYRPLMPNNGIAGGASGMALPAGVERGYPSSLFRQQDDAVSSGRNRRWR